MKVIRVIGAVCTIVAITGIAACSGSQPAQPNAAASHTSSTPAASHTSSTPATQMSSPAAMPWNGIYYSTGTITSGNVNLYVRSDGTWNIKDESGIMESGTYKAVTVPGRGTYLVITHDSANNQNGSCPEQFTDTPIEVSVLNPAYEADCGLGWYSPGSHGIAFEPADVGAFWNRV